MSDGRQRVSRRRFLATGLATGAGVVVLPTIACGDDESDVHGRRDLGPEDASPDTDATPGSDSDVVTDASDIGPEADSNAQIDSVETAEDVAEVELPPRLRFDPDPYPEASESIFPIGVGASDPDSVAGGVILATKYVGGDALELVVWQEDGAGPGGLLVVREPVTVGDGGFVQRDVAGLEGGATHGYVFIAGGRRSPVGGFKAAPAVDARPVVVLGASSCARWDLRPFGVLARAAEVELDLFLLLGDTTYADDAKTLAEYRDNWARNLGTPEYRALRAATMTAATWDDHEVDNNWDPETFDPVRLQAARQAFFEHMALRRSESAPERIWRSLRWGATLEVFMLDCRGERRPSTRDTAAAEYVSEAQLAWLSAGLSNSPAVFKIVVTSVPITDWPLLFLGADQRWEGYAAQRSKALTAADGIPGVLWLAGDFHFGAVTRVDPPGGKYADQREVLVGPIAHLNPAVAVVQATGSPEQFPFLSGDRNYGRFTLDPTTSPPRITVEHIGADGKVLATNVIET